MISPHQGVAEGEVQVARIDGTPPEGEDDNLTSLLQLEPTPEQPKGSVRLAQEQRQDAYLLMLIQYLEEGKLPDDSVQAKKIVAQSNQYVLCDGVLYLMDKKCARKRAVVPAQLRTELIEGVHGSAWRAFSRSLLIQPDLPYSVPVMVVGRNVQ